ncbi:LysR family transcriptional regulator [Dyella caseinilytica]|uniref:LysR family transcriptional regulator n=1 Tax=Dyella caseinilytica TaxID=1849581 RepID=A0ABX7GVC4_9GAMM|nr:LysR family transcriptional regulator [Dyella caseinilytica]QRN53697.1 LysR family transcriptional regulator [Dyella caseinilytica]GFZ88579.1 LysR family transcriptional regulator [Dyella caseinilytica]
MEDFSAISAFVRVVEAKSFASAAAQLGMTPSGVSRAVSRLEEHLGVRLLFRSTRALRLTDDGASFYTRCKEILADLTEATEALGYSHRKPTGKLRVGMSVSVGRAAIIPLLSEFEKRYPDIRLELMMCDYPYDLNEEGVDCAIRMGELEDSSLIARKIGYFRNVLLASPEYLQKYGAPSSLDDLKNHRCINYVYPNGRPRQWQFDTSSGRIEVDVNAHMLINDGESVIQAAVAGLGIIQAPHVLAACMLDLGKLEPVMTDTVSTGKNVWIVYPQKKHLSARVQAFIEWSRELFERPFESVCQMAPAPVVDALRPVRELPAPQRRTQ